MIISFFDNTLTLYHKKRLIQTVNRIKIMKERIISEVNKNMDMQIILLFFSVEYIILWINNLGASYE